MGFLLTFGQKACQDEVTQSACLSISNSHHHHNHHQHHQHQHHHQHHHHHDENSQDIPEKLCRQRAYQYPESITRQVKTNLRIQYNLMLKEAQTTLIVLENCKNPTVKGTLLSELNN